MTQPLSQCPCCGKDFANLSSLMTHVKATHTEAEILDCEDQTSKKKEFAAVV